MSVDLPRLARLTQTRSITFSDVPKRFLVFLMKLYLSTIDRVLKGPGDTLGPTVRRPQLSSGDFNTRLLIQHGDVSSSLTVKLLLIASILSRKPMRFALATPISGVQWSPRVATSDPIHFLGIYHYTKGAAKKAWGMGRQYQYGFEGYIVSRRFTTLIAGGERSNFEPMTRSRLYPQY